MTKAVTSSHDSSSVSINLQFALISIRFPVKIECEFDKYKPALTQLINIRVRPCWNSTPEPTTLRIFVVFFSSLLYTNVGKVLWHSFHIFVHLSRPNSTDQNHWLGLRWSLLRMHQYSCYSPVRKHFSVCYAVRQEFSFSTPQATFALSYRLAGRKFLSLNEGRLLKMLLRHIILLQTSHTLDYSIIYLTKLVMSEIFDFA
jgi:hypothetical protein